MTTGRLGDVAAGARRLQNLAWEKRLGISTRGSVPVDHPDSVHYASMGYPTIHRTLAALDLGGDDVFVDIGCGRGRVLCCAARRPVRRVVGVDISAQLCADARQNAGRARGLRAPVEVHHGGADAFDYSEATACFLFSPFGVATLRRVLAKVGEDRRGLPVRFAYANPAYPEAFDEQPWLEPYDVPSGRGEHAVAFYRSTG